MDHMINLMSYLPQQEAFDRKEQKNRRIEWLLAFTESIATLVIAGAFLLLVAACLAAL